MSVHIQYGLNFAPFSRTTLNPLEKKKDSELLVEVDGLRGFKQQIDEYIVGKSRDDGPALFVVAGERGTGRSAVANYILARYRDLRAVKPERFLVVPLRAKDHNVDVWFCRWFIHLKTVIDASKIFDLGEAIKGLEDIEKLTQHTDLLSELLNQRASKVTEALASQQNSAVVAIHLDSAHRMTSLDTPAIIRMASEIFANTPTVGVFTWCISPLDEDFHLFRKSVQRDTELGKLKIVTLWPLSPEDIADFVQSCWNNAGGQENDLPFGPDDVGTLLGEPNLRPCGLIQRFMAELIEMKASAHPKSSWPADKSLQIGREEIRQQISRLEGCLYGI